jgi:TonB family protein
MIEAMSDTNNLGTTSRRTRLPATALLVAFSVVLLACATTRITQNQRPGARVPLRQSAVPSDSVIRAAIVTMLDSTGYNTLNWVWCAPDGSLWMKSSSPNFTQLRHRGPDGRRMDADRSFWVSPHETRMTPICQLGDSLLLFVTELYSNNYPQPTYLGRTTPTARRSFGDALGNSEQTTLTGEDGTLHLFGYAGLGRVYARYLASGDSMLLVDGRNFGDSVVHVADSGWRHVKRPDGPPWCRDPRTVLSWTDTYGVAAALTLVDSTGTAVASRFTVPGMEVLDSARFSVTGSAAFRTAIADCRQMMLIRTSDGFWAFVPSTAWARRAKDETCYVYACRLDRTMRPLATGRVVDQIPAMFSMAPPGSKVFIDAGDEVNTDSAWVTRHSVSTRFLAYGSDGRTYLTRAQDSAAYRSTSDTTVVMDGDPMGRVVLYLPVYPVMARYARIEGTPMITIVFGPSGAVDSALVARSCGNQGMDNAALHAGRRARLVNPGTHNANVARALDVSYEFRLGDRPPLGQIVDVRVHKD